MSERSGLPLAVVDALELGEEYRRVLRPGELLPDRTGALRRLPRFFYEVPSWDTALETELTEHFALWEFMNVDVREHELLRVRWPRYVPCAVSVLAAALELLRREVGTFVHVAANGGYRSPAHRLNEHASTHCWGTAANLYRIGDDWLDDQGTITRYNRIARRVMPGISTRAYGPDVAQTDDHVHMDLGYVTLVPHGTPGEVEGDEGRGKGAGRRESNE
jgi:hypothetical protein